MHSAEGGRKILQKVLGPGHTLVLFALFLNRKGSDNAPAYSTVPDIFSWNDLRAFNLMEERKEDRPTDHVKCFGQINENNILGSPHFRIMHDLRYCSPPTECYQRLI
jgi:hypothetical protein